MRSVALGLLVLTVACLGCVPSLNPIYTDKQLVFDADLLGNWSQDGTQNTWELTRRDQNSYYLMYTEDSGTQGRFIARLADVNGTRFLDMFPDDSFRLTNELYKSHWLPTHTIYLVRNLGETAELGVFDGDWLNEFLTANPQAVSFLQLANHKLLTAGTPELQKFLLANLDHFTGTVKLTHRRDLAR